MKVIKITIYVLISIFVPSILFAKDNCICLLEIDNNLWIQKDNIEFKQLTSNNSGIEAAVFMNTNKIAYVSSDNKISDIVIIDESGKALKEMPHMTFLSSYVRALIYKKGRLFVIGHSNPWYGAVEVIDTSTGKRLYDVLGTGFTISDEGNIANFCVEDTRNGLPVPLPSICVNNDDEPIFILDKGEFISNLMWINTQELLSVVIENNSYSILLLKIKGRKAEKTLIPLPLSQNVKINKEETKIIKIKDDVYIHINIFKEDKDTLKSSEEQFIYKYKDRELKEIRKDEMRHDLISKIDDREIEIQLNNELHKKAKIIDYKCE